MGPDRTTLRERTAGGAPACWLTLLLTLLTAAPLALAVPALAGPVKKTTEADWYRHDHDDKYYTESWTTVALTDDGHFLNVNFVYSNIGVVGGNTSVNVAVTPPGATQAKHFRFNHGTGDFAENRGTHRIVIGPNSMTLRGRELHVVVEEEGVALDLTITSWTDGVKWGDGTIHLDEGKREFVRTFFHVPRGDLRGTATVAGTKMTLEGAAYMDHTLQNKLATDFSTRWWTLRLFGAADSLAFITFRTAADEDAGRKERFHGRALWVRRDGVVVFTKTVRVKPGSRTKDPKGHSYATRYRFSFSGAGLGGGGGVVEGSVKSAGLVDREAFMEDLSWIERQVAEMVAGNPIVYRMKATPDVTVTPEGGAPRKLDGPAVIESIVMQPEAEGGE